MVTPAEAIDRISRTFEAPGGHRALHAKGRFYTGTFHASEAAASVCRAPHLQGDEIPVLVRWSNGGANPRTRDDAPDVRGMAVSFRLPDGSATDLLGQTAPRFPVRTPEDFVELVEAARRPALMPRFLLRHPRALPAVAANARAKSVVPPRSFAEVTYYPIHAYEWTSPHGRRRWVRYLVVPFGAPDGRPTGTYGGRDRLFDEMAARLEQGPVRFTLEVRLAGPSDDPHDPMSVWGRESHVLEVGTIEVTAPDPQREQDGEVVVFDPTRVVDGIGLSDDPILRFRPAAYSESVSRRVS